MKVGVHKIRLIGHGIEYLEQARVQFFARFGLARQMDDKRRFLTHFRLLCRMRWPDFGSTRRVMRLAVNYVLGGFQCRSTPCVTLFGSIERLRRIVKHPKATATRRYAGYPFSPLP